MATARADGTLRISNREFATAFENLKQGNGPGNVIEARVYAASGFVIRQRRGIADDEPFSLTPEDVVEFLNGIDDLRVKRLKKIAEGLQGPEEEPIH
jgi:hypothetical protein